MGQMWSKEVKGLTFWKVEGESKVDKSPEKEGWKNNKNTYF